MTAQRQRTELVPDDHPGLAQALRLIEQLCPSEQEHFLVEALRAVYTQQETGANAALETFADDVVATVRLRSRPGYGKVLARAAERPDALPSVGGSAVART